MKNTYSLLVQSEEKGRTLFEGAVIALLILSTAFTGWQLASTSVVVPGVAVTKRAPAPTTMVAKAVVAKPVVADRS